MEEGKVRETLLAYEEGSRVGLDELTLLANLGSEEADDAD